MSPIRSSLTRTPTKRGDGVAHHLPLLVVTRQDTLVAVPVIRAGLNHDPY